MLPGYSAAAALANYQQMVSSVNSARQTAFLASVTNSPSLNPIQLHQLMTVAAANSGLPGTVSAVPRGTIVSAVPELESAAFPSQRPPATAANSAGPQLSELRSSFSPFITKRGLVGNSWGCFLPITRYMFC